MELNSFARKWLLECWQQNFVLVAQIIKFHGKSSKNSRSNRPFCNAGGVIFAPTCKKIKSKLYDRTGGIMSATIKLEPTSTTSMFIAAIQVHAILLLGTHTFRPPGNCAVKCDTKSWTLNVVVIQGQRFAKRLLSATVRWFVSKMSGCFAYRFSQRVWRFNSN